MVKVEGMGQEEAVGLIMPLRTGEAPPGFGEEVDIRLRGEHVRAETERKTKEAEKRENDKRIPTE